jgi:hypothetical protein
MRDANACPSCDAILPADAVLCVECGYHLLKKKHLETKKKRVRRSWDVGPTPAAQVALIVLILLVPLGVEIVRQFEDWWVLIIAPPVALIATVFGYRLILDRDNKGKWRLTRHGWFFFQPIGKVVLDLSRYEALYTDFLQGGEDEGGVYVLELRGDRVPAVVIYRGNKERFARELMDMMQYQVGLRIERM